LVHSVILLNDSKGVLLNDDTLGFALLNAVGTTHAIAAGGKSKRKGAHLVQGELGTKPEFVSSGESVGKLILTRHGISHSKLSISTENISQGITVPYQIGYSNSDILIPTKNHSTSQLIYKTPGESWGVSHPSIVMEKFLKDKLAKLKRLMEFSALLHQVEDIDNLHPTCCYCVCGSYGI